MKHDPLTTTSNESLAGALRRIRAFRGLGCREVSTAARAHGFGLTPIGVSELERCKRCWSALMIDAVATGLGICTAELLLEAAALSEGDTSMIASAEPPGKKQPAAA